MNHPTKETGALTDPSPCAGPRLRPGTTVGRYRIHGRIGEGGMGVVYAAEDPELARRIALKFVRGRPGAGRQGQILTEARALARINHPNVLPVFDVGELAPGRVFLAVELVEGSTLEAWLQRRRCWREIVAAFVAAGCGLAEAHRQGLVHRDFKPTNVLRGNDGRILVMDFGLATAMEGESTARDALDSERGGRVVLGTPAFMAPEQLRGAEVDERADQFSFCVALYHALYGIFPFPTALHARTVAMQRRQPIVAPSAGTPVPAHVRRAVTRGLALHPAERWPTMDALLEALTARRQRRWRAAAGLAVVLGGASAGMLVDARRPGCPRAELNWHAQRGAVRAAFQRWPRGHMEATFRLVDDRISAYVDAWTRAQEEACTLADGRARDVRLACLSARATAAAAFIEGLADADPAQVDSAVVGVASLDPIDGCLDEDVRLEAGPALAVFEIRRTLAEARGLRRAGRYADATPKAELALTRALAIDSDALVGRSALELGHLRFLAGDADASVRTLEQAVSAATAAGLDGVAADAAAHLGLVYAQELQRFADADRWFRHAEAKLARLDGLDRVRRDVLNKAGVASTIAGRYAEAADKHERAAELTAALEGPDSPKYAVAVLNLANAYLLLPDYDRAADAAARGRRIAGRTLGPLHPWVGNALNTQGGIALARGQSEKALDLFRRAGRVHRAAFGADHPETGVSMVNAALTLEELQRYPEALEPADEAVRLWRATLGASDPRLAQALTIRGIARAELGDLDGALRDQQEALLIQEATFGKGDKHTANALTNLGTLMRRLGRPTDAAAFERRAAAARANDRRRAPGA